MKREIRRIAGIAVAAASLLAASAAVQAAELVTEDEIIDALLPVTVRGVKVVEAPKPAMALPMIQFEFDSFRLTPAAVEQLRILGKALNSEALSGFPFLIEGHTDAKGTRAYNQTLSERRAAAVRDYLVQNAAIAPDRLASKGLGEDRPLHPADPEHGENRRVEIVNVGE